MTGLARVGGGAEEGHRVSRRMAQGSVPAEDEVGEGRGSKSIRAFLGWVPVSIGSWI